MSRQIYIHIFAMRSKTYWNGCDAERLKAGYSFCRENKLRNIIPVRRARLHVGYNTKRHNESYAQSKKTKDSVNQFQSQTKNHHNHQNYDCRFEMRPCCFEKSRMVRISIRFMHMSWVNHRKMKRRIEIRKGRESLLCRWKMFVWHYVSFRSQCHLKPTITNGLNSLGYYERNPNGNCTRQRGKTRILFSHSELHFDGSKIESTSLASNSWTS